MVGCGLAPHGTMTIVGASQDDKIMEEEILKAPDLSEEKIMKRLHRVRPSPVTCRVRVCCRSPLGRAHL